MELEFKMGKNERFLFKIMKNYEVEILISFQVWRFDVSFSDVVRTFAAFLYICQRSLCDLHISEMGFRSP